MAQGSMKAPLAISKRFNYTNIPITTLSGGGVYYCPAGSRSIAVAGYTAIGVSICDWDSLASNVLPYIAQSTQTLGFMADVSQTVGGLDVLITYLRNN